MEKSIKSPPTTLGVIVGNRGFFPRHLCDRARQTVLKVLSEEKIQAIIPDQPVESLSDAQKCADLFRRHREQIDGILITLPNFGDEKAVANTLRLAGLNVPVLVQAFPDDLPRMSVENRRDSFCGKISVCNNLHQYGIPFSLTGLHVVDPESDPFRADLDRFLAICRILKGLKNARLGMIGARPSAFNTVRFSEKILERSGISIEPWDLSEVYAKASQLSDHDPLVEEKIQQIQDYLPVSSAPPSVLPRTAKLAVVIETWMSENDLKAAAIQCWTSMEMNYGIAPCLLMSMMSNRLVPLGCETDICGAIGMYILALASGLSSALVDWNNNLGDDPDCGVLFHCSNLPKDLLVSEGSGKEAFPQVGVQEILAQTYGKENTWGAISGRLRPSPITAIGLMTDDYKGRICAYLTEGELLDRKISTFGGYGAIRIPNFQNLLKNICASGFGHHVAINPSRTAEAVEEALGKYMGWDVYRFNG
jgi:L-fucose isomerase-like protein